MNTPVAFIIFRRPDLTRRVFAEIAKARPPVLLVVADGPRNDGEREACRQARAVVERVDWPCRVLRDYAEVNLGCRRRVSSGLDWVFGQVEEAVILEDDCLPNPSFFRFCDELVERHRNDQRVMHIGGANFQPRRVTDRGCYVSKFNHVWGWASWRRAWRHYDLGMKQWPEFRDSGALRHWCPSRDERYTWTRTFDRMHAGAIDTWDYAWTFACWANSGLSFVPAVNLVSNIGFGGGATHTEGRPAFAEMPTVELTDFSEPDVLAPDMAADRYVYELMYGERWARFRRARAALRNPYLYGKWLRRLPVVGPAWARWRASRPGARPEGDMHDPA